MTLQQVPVANGTANPNSSTKCDVKLELAFEYLMSKDRLQWVTITSPQVSAVSVDHHTMSCEPCGVLQEFITKQTGMTVNQ